MAVDFVEDEDMPEYRNMLSDVCEIAEGLSTKEIDFIDGLSHWEGNFTVGQVQWLKRIYDRMVL